MTDYSVETCHMPQEYTIALIYLTCIMILIFKIFNIKQFFWDKNVKTFINNKYQHLFNHTKLNH